MLLVAGVDRELAHALSLAARAGDEVDALQLPTRLRDRRGQLAERLLARVELDPHRDAVLSADGRRRAWAADRMARATGRHAAARDHLMDGSPRVQPAGGPVSSAGPGAVLGWDACPRRTEVEGEPAPAETDGELFLIDGNSLAYRAFFALPESIATADGRPTNAIYGFASMMAKVLIEYRPQSVIVAWDAGMSGREQTYPAVQGPAPVAARPALASNGRTWCRWPRHSGIENVKVAGWEADDVIASLAARPASEAIPAMVVSGDRDVYQLVSDGVRVMTTSRGVTDTKVYDREGVIDATESRPSLSPT